LWQRGSSRHALEISPRPDNARRIAVRVKDEARSHAQVLVDRHGTEPSTSLIKPNGDIEAADQGRRRHRVDSACDVAGLEYVLVNGVAGDSAVVTMLVSTESHQLRPGAVPSASRSDTCRTLSRG